MGQRPLSVTIIGWILFLFGIFGLIAVAMASSGARALLAQSPLPYGVHVAISVVVNILTMACAVGILKGFDWARVCYIAITVVGTLIALTTSPIKSPILLNLIITAVIAFFLFRRPADEFFGKSYFGRGVNAPDA